MKTISIKSLLLSLFMAIVGGLFLGATAGIPVAPLAGGLFAASFLPGKAGVAMMAIQKEIWINDIVANLFKANPHLNLAMNADAFVLNGKVVHIPNAGAKPAVVRNRKNFPATVLLRQDSDITFVLDEYTSDPIKIENADNYELSYDKRASVLSEQQSAINELVGDWFYYYWSPILAAQIKRTTGDAVAAHYGTGNRRKIQVADIKAMQKEFTKQGVPSQNRYCSMDADTYDQLTDSMTATQYKDFSQYLDVKNGTIGKMFGFDFLEPRATVLRYSNASTPVPHDPDAAVASADNAGSLFWQKDLVIRALGEKDFFENLKDATHYGDIYSALVRGGGRIKRADGKGVFALVQAAV